MDDKLNIYCYSFNSEFCDKIYHKCDDKLFKEFIHIFNNVFTDTWNMLTIEFML
jgi:hypothetical protein